MNLDWDNQTGATFSVYRGTSPTFSIVGQSPIYTGTTSAYSDTSTKDSKVRYYYKIVANVSGYDDSTPVEVHDTERLTPSGLEAFVVSGTKVQLYWDSTQSNISYRIYRGSTSSFTPNDSTNFVASVDWTHDDYQDTTVSADQSYYYKVVASYSSGLGQINAIATAAVMADTTYLTTPPAPSEVRVTLNVNEDSFDVDVSWKDTCRLATPFTVYRSVNGGGWDVVGTLTPTQTHFFETSGDLSADFTGASDLSIDGSTVSYKVTTTNGHQESPSSPTGSDSTIQMSSGSGAGRPINPCPNPGPTVTPTNIYHINDEEAVGRQGHSAVIIPNGFGCTYWSYSIDGVVITQTYANITDALSFAREAGYTRYQYWACNESQANAAAAKAGSFNGKKYDPGIQNCWTVVYEALHAAGTNATNELESPNREFLINNNLADGNGEL